MYNENLTSNTSVTVLTAGLLRELIGDRNIPQLSSLIGNRKDDEMLDLINRDDYIASILWSKEDVAGAIKECGYEATEKNIVAVINSGMLKGLNECSDSDWEVIYHAVRETLGK